MTSIEVYLLKLNLGSGQPEKFIWISILVEATNDKGAEYCLILKFKRSSEQKQNLNLQPWRKQNQMSPRSQPLATAAASRTPRHALSSLHSSISIQHVLKQEC